RRIATAPTTASPTKLRAKLSVIERELTILRIRRSMSRGECGVGAWPLIGHQFDGATRSPGHPGSDVARSTLPPEQPSDDGAEGASWGNGRSLSSAVDIWASGSWVRAGGENLCPYFAVIRLQLGGPALELG